MSTTYHSVHWNTQKRVYDAALLLLVILATVSFQSISAAIHPAMTIETRLLRSSAFLCLFLIQLILCIGPLARINPRFLPLLYNRRHLGVCLFLLALVHALIALIQHHALGDTFPLVSLFTSYAHEYAAAFSTDGALARIPFEPFGALALVILFLMAATSHDFWLRLLGASAWKALHTLVYFAYALILFHVAFGFLQGDVHVIYPIFVLSGAALVFLLHLVALIRGPAPQLPISTTSPPDEFVPVCKVSELAEDQGKSIRVGKRRLALYRHGDRVFALSGVCRHQGGPIGEGRIVDGCVTCPWHGWQYKPEDGMSPPPFDEHIPAYPVEIREDTVYVKPRALDRGTACDGAIVPPTIMPAGQSTEPFYIGYLSAIPEPLTNFLHVAAGVILLASPLFMAIMAAAQPETDRGTFEFGTTRTLEGVFYTIPVPSLYVTAGPDRLTHPSGFHYLLCGTGKFAIPDSWASYSGQKVSLAGTLIYRNQVAMVEVSPGRPPEALGAPEPHEARPDTEILGPVTLIGELVDTKCYLGVMRPATGKVHRACAIRCLSGGIPPGLRVQSRDEETAILLAGPQDEPLKYDVTWAARLVRAEGILERQNGFSILRVNQLSLFDGDMGDIPEPEFSDYG